MDTFYQRHLLCCKTFCGPDVVNHYGLRRQPEDQLRTVVRLICTEVLKEEKNKTTEHRKEDADICKRSDTDFEKAFSSGWLMNTGVKLPCGSQSNGGNLKPTDSTCTFLLLKCLLLVEAWRLLEYFLCFVRFKEIVNPFWILGVSWAYSSPGECPKSPLVSFFNSVLSLYKAGSPLWRHINFLF